MSRFSFLEMQVATSDFHDDFVIGRGGFGKVYKGVIDYLGTTTAVAVKRLDPMSRQGSREFETEIEMLSKFRHCHLVSLIGYCDESSEMILVYEYMPGGTLADHLHRKVRNGDNSLPRLSWVQRLEICIGAARGLDYLHTGTSTENRVIHRDVKTTNILLDKDLAAKVSDFGLSKIGPANLENSDVSTHVKGSFGYIDPYYLSTRTLTRKSDVYSFGVVLFEVLCGRPALDNSLGNQEQRCLAGWAQHCFKEGLLDQIIDPSIKRVAFDDSLMAFVEVAIKCLESVPKNRPTMAEVVVALQSALVVQEKSTHYSLPVISIHNQENVNVEPSNHELENANQNQGLSDKPSAQERVINSRRHIERSSSKSTFITKTRQFFSRGGHSVPVGGGVAELRTFSLTELKRATRNFGSDMLLNKRQSTRVFKGWVHKKTYAPCNDGVGMAIAVKRFLDSPLEWENEKTLLEEYSNLHLVKLLGYCQEKEAPVLVFEYMEKGSLDTHLFQCLEPLSWNIRIKILIGAARCLAFFHTAKKQVIYCGFKSSHVLLDGEFNAKLSGYGDTRLFPSSTEINVKTKQSRTWDLKTDVYDFGVVLLEVMTGKRIHKMPMNNSGGYWGKYYQTMVHLAAHLTTVTLDPTLVDNFPKTALIPIASLTKNCLDRSPETRPSMLEVVNALEQIGTMTEQA